MTEKTTMRKRQRYNYMMITLPDDLMSYIRQQAEKEERPMTFICRRLILSSPELKGVSHE